MALPVSEALSLTHTKVLPEEALQHPAAEARPTPHLVVLKGPQMGREFRLDPGHVIIGRAPDSDIALADDNVSRRHALIVCERDGKIFIEDLGSKNGTLVNGRRIRVRYLRGGERLVFGARSIFRFELRDRIEQEYASRLYESATQDALTGAHNARYFHDQLQVELSWHARHKQPLSLLMIDVDHFKQINDRYGHVAGDAVLQRLASACRDLVRAEDLFARYGGEEFACLLRQTPLEAARHVAERMRRTIEGTRVQVRCGDSLTTAKITVSIGVVELVGETAPKRLIEAADRLLYRAKGTGRNRVVADSFTP
jgi:two-component system cell cycle response regulator